MATMNPYFPERRQLPERRTNVSLSMSDRARGMNALDWVAMTLLIIGGLNWGLIGFFNYDLVASLFGEGTSLSRLIYALVGLSALYSIYTATKMARTKS
jgi:uncharacterized membrane protein YuzA (DUF378 family)